jgi:solute carrier family 35 protein E1
MMFRQVSARARALSDHVSDKVYIDWKLVVLVFLWYAGNWFHNVANKKALEAGGGIEGYPLIISTGYIAAGALYAIFLWIVPDARPRPKITFQDYLRTLPVGFAFAAAHMSACFALSAGSLSFVQIVKAMEPAFAAVIGIVFYATNVSRARWLCLIPIIGGVVVAFLGDLSFGWSALLNASIANVFAAVRSNENKKLMLDEGLTERLGSVSNQFALTTINGFFVCAVIAAICEGHKLGSFVEFMQSDEQGPVVRNNTIASGLWFYFFNELSTIIIDKTGAVTQSVLNTGKRAFVVIGAAILLREDLSLVKLIGSSVSIVGVFVYSNIDSWGKESQDSENGVSMGVKPQTGNRRQLGA